MGNMSCCTCPAAAAAAAAAAATVVAGYAGVACSRPACGRPAHASTGHAQAPCAVKRACDLCCRYPRLCLPASLLKRVIASGAPGDVESAKGPSSWRTAASSHRLAQQHRG
jgi:hypothetical protein